MRLLGWMFIIKIVSLTYFINDCQIVDRLHCVTGLFICDWVSNLALEKKKKAFCRLKKEGFFNNQQTKIKMGEPVRPSELKNKHKRENLYQKQRLEKQKAKATKRKQLAKAEEKNPELKKVCILFLSTGNTHDLTLDSLESIETFGRECAKNFR